MDALAIANRDIPFAAVRDRIRPGFELLIVVGSLEASLWHLREAGPAWLNTAAHVLAVAAIWWSWDRRRRSRSVVPTPPIPALKAWGSTLAVCLALSAILLFAAQFVGDGNETYEFLFLDKPPMKLLEWGVGKFLAALGQQLALQLFLWPVCFELTRGRASGAIAAGAIFGLIHLPSPTLVAITFLAGVAWIALYQRIGRIAPLVASHMILAILAHGALPERLTYDLRVGISAAVDMKRFENLNDPKVRAINYRLKVHRADLRRFSSQAYFDRQGGTQAGYIRGLYRDILGRPATQADITFWMTRPKKPSRDELASFFLASDEYAAIYEGTPIAEAPTTKRHR
ncbi:CPBP family glutamic-type intramembrane protease [Tundrisphaera sp. TA3]|uniref:CPBP family glutamic-type intramembrane protease n=1 Tax=Tundrisphaera sp. TA3 TaxID=3435775 RepID=UPI003EBE0F75